MGTLCIDKQQRSRKLVMGAIVPVFTKQSLEGILYRQDIFSFKLGLVFSVNIHRSTSKQAAGLKE